MKTFACSLFVLISVLGFGQSGGVNTLDFLQLVQPARISAIGGANLSVFDGDANMTGFNPGLLNGQMHDKVALNFVDYFAGINYGNVSYTYGIDTVVDRVAQVNLMNANYGTMQYADATGQLTGGSFTANDANTLPSSGSPFFVIFKRQVGNIPNLPCHMGKVVEVMTI